MAVTGSLLLTRAPRRRRLPPGEAGLRRRLASLAARCSPGPYSHTVPSGPAPPARREERAGRSVEAGTSLMLEERDPRGAVAAAGALRGRQERRLPARVRLDDDEAVLGEHRRQVGGEGGLHRGERPVGWVEEHEIVTPACGGLGGESPERVSAQDGAAEPQLVEVALDRAARLAVRLDEDGGGGVAGEGLEPHRPGAGEEVEHRRTVHGPDEHERRLARAVARGARVGSPGRLDAVALARPGDDAHGG